MAYQINIPLIASIIAFTVFVFLFYGVFQLVRHSSKKQKIQDKIAGYDDGSSESSHLKGLKKSEKKPPKGIFNFVGSIGKSLHKEETGTYSPTRLKFLRAGYRTASAPAIFFGAKILMTIIFMIIFLVCRVIVFTMLSPQRSLIVGLSIAFLGFYGPEFWLQNKITKRKIKLLEALPDALDLLGLCVEAGVGIDLAFNRVAHETELSHPVLSNEIKYFTAELRAGTVRSKALKNLALRSGLDELSSLVTLLNQTERFGTSIVQTLRVYSDAFRSERFQRAEEIAAKLPIKLLFPMIFFIFPSLFAVLLGPAFITIYHNIIEK